MGVRRESKHQLAEAMRARYWAARRFLASILVSARLTAQAFQPIPCLSTLTPASEKRFPACRYPLPQGVVNAAAEYSVRCL